MNSYLSSGAEAGLAAYRKAESECYNNSDLALVEHFSEDFILSSNGQDNVVGREAARELFTNIWSAYDARFISVDDDTVIESGNFLFVTGRFVLELKPKDGSETIIDKGRFHGILVKADNGRYLLWRESCTDAGAAE